MKRKIVAVRLLLVLGVGQVEMAGQAAAGGAVPLEQAGHAAAGGPPLTLKAALDEALSKNLDVAAREYAGGQVPVVSVAIDLHVCRGGEKVKDLVFGRRGVEIRGKQPHCNEWRRDLCNISHDVSRFKFESAG